MKKILFLILLICSTSKASTETQDRQQIFEIMNDYTRVVSCMSSFEKEPEGGRPTRLNDIITVEYNNEDQSFVYYVLWSGDMGCAGGSGTMSSFVTEVARYGGDWKPYTIQTDYAFGEDVGINYGYIESIKKINSHKFEVVAWDFADSKYGGVDGGSNFPANKFKYTLEHERFKPWKITHQALLEQRK